MSKRCVHPRATYDRGADGGNETHKCVILYSSVLASPNKTPAKSTMSFNIIHVRPPDQRTITKHPDSVRVKVRSSSEVVTQLLFIL